MNPPNPAVTLRTIILSCLMAMPAAAQDQSPPLNATPMPVDAKIAAVTMYRSRAAVTRRAAITLPVGLYDLRFANLPESVQPQSLHARTTGPMKVLAVDYMQEQTTVPAKQFAEIDATIEELQLGVKSIGEQRELIKVQEDFIAAVGAKATTEAGKEVATEKLDLEALRRQLAFVGEERQKLLTARRELDAKQRDLEKKLQAAQANRAALGGGSNVSRTAVVAVAVTETGPASVELTYLVAETSWEPTYNVRASLEGSSAVVEYDATLSQRTGEDWDNVQLTLSTARPTVAANPPALQPWFVDVYRPPPPAALPPQAPAAAASDRKGFEGRSLEMMKSVDAAKLGEELGKLAADAEVAGTGPAISFQLPRTVTVKTNAQKQQQTRIATIDAHAKFVHMAVPALTEAVYIRGELTNASAYQLLPGRAAIFVGQDYVGPTTIDSVAANAEFQVHFGIDPSVKATRQMISKRNENTGLLSGGRRTSYDYRMTIDNGAGKPITLELWDRYPVSRSEEIQVELVDLNQPLAADARYVAEEKPQGMLKWLLNVPAGATGNAAFVVSYGVRINRAKGVEMTALPE